MHWSDIYLYYTFNGQIAPSQEPVTPDCQSPEDVRVYNSAWVSNAQVIKSLGTKEVIIRGDNLEMDIVIEALESRIKKDAFYVGANAVLNFSCDLHLWDSPATYRATGTRCVLRYTT